MRQPVIDLSQYRIIARQLTHHQCYVIDFRYDISRDVNHPKVGGEPEPNRAAGD
jgi:hypothetical protein